jgi:hypothetical protein
MRIASTGQSDSSFLMNSLSTNFSLYSNVYNKKGILSKFLISKVEKSLLECPLVPHFFNFRSTYGQSIKLAKKPQSKNEVFLSSF